VQKAREIAHLLLATMFRAASGACIVVGIAYQARNQEAVCTGENASERTFSYSTSEQLVRPLQSTTTGKPGSFAIVYDNRTRNPKYVIEALYGAGVVCTDDEIALEKKKKRKPFYCEPSIQVEAFRVCCSCLAFRMVSVLCGFLFRTRCHL
jgi:DNA/RNA endonuclease G (NUC1)